MNSEEGCCPWMKNVEEYLLKQKEKRNRIKEILVNNPNELIKNLKEYIWIKDYIRCENNKYQDVISFYFCSECEYCFSYEVKYHIERRDKVFRRIFFDPSLKNKEEAFLKREKRYSHCEIFPRVNNYLVCDKEINDYLISCYLEDTLGKFINPTIDFGISDNSAISIREKLRSFQSLLLDERFSFYDETRKIRILKDNIVKRILVQIYILSRKMKEHAFNHGNLTSKKISFSIEEIKTEEIKESLILKIEDFKYSSVNISSYRLLPQTKEIDILVEHKSYISEIIDMKAYPSFCNEKLLEGDYCPEKVSFCSSLDLCQKNNERKSTFFVLKEEAISAVNALRSLNVPSFSALEYYILMLIFFRETKSIVSEYAKKIWTLIWNEDEINIVEKRIDESMDQEETIYLYFKILAGIHLRCNILDYIKDFI